MFLRPQPETRYHFVLALHKHASLIVNTKYIFNFVLIVVQQLCLILGKAVISNDGATILKTLDIVHPAAKTLVDIAKSQDAEVNSLYCSTSIHSLLFKLATWF